MPSVPSRLTHLDLDGRPSMLDVSAKAVTVRVACARVSICQLGQEIYQTDVPPGPFVIDEFIFGRDQWRSVGQHYRIYGGQHAFTKVVAVTCPSLRRYG